MKQLDMTMKDQIRSFIPELTTTDVTPDGVRVQSIDCENSHRGKFFTNVVIKFHEEDIRNYMNRKNLTMPVPDKLIGMCNNGDGNIEHIWRCIIAGALHKAGFFAEYEAVPEKDESLF